MRVSVLGVALWGRGLCSYDDLLQVVVAGCLPQDAAFQVPKPEAIPPRERRRAGLLINLAVTVAHQACEHAGVDKSLVPSVFVSSMGDTDITDYMCRKLAQPEKLLSPTKFHNSVHNAASGYWTISAENRAPSTFVGGFDYSFGAGLLEAASQAQAGNQPVLLVIYDIANQLPFADISPIPESFAAGLVLGPAGAVGHGLAVDLGMELVAGEPGSQPASKLGCLNQLMSENPAADSLRVLEPIARMGLGQQQSAQLNLAAGTQLDLRLTLESPEAS